MSLFASYGLSKRFEGITALNDVTLSVPEGAIMGLIGPNGAGKTTFFNVVSGILPPTSGDISFMERSIVGLKPYRISAMGIARTFQNIRLFSGMTVSENVLVARHVRTRSGIFSDLLGIGRAKAKDRESKGEIEGILDLVGLSDCADVTADSLPYGRQRRLEIARALATGPRLILLDEPSAGMNTRETEDIMDLIRKIRERGVTILLIEHDMYLVMGICDSIVVLDHGVKIDEGTPEKIRRSRRVIEAYLGREEDYEVLGKKVRDKAR
jgi:branched-chain amino acid transport system ATP-binding protein